MESGWSVLSIPVNKGDSPYEWCNKKRKILNESTSLYAQKSSHCNNFFSSKQKVQILLKSLLGLSMLWETPSKSGVVNFISVKNFHANFFQKSICQETIKYKRKGLTSTGNNNHCPDHIPKKKLKIFCRTQLYASGKLLFLYLASLPQTWITYSKLRIKFNSLFSKCMFLTLLWMTHAVCG